MRHASPTEFTFRIVASLPAAMLVIAACAGLATAGAPADSGVVVVPAASVPERSTVFGADKFQHASLSFTIGLGTGIATRSPGWAVGVTLALGTAKELRDRRHTKFDALDLAADLAGAALAAALTRRFIR